jgi:GT2 family glycosyltransferase
MTSKPLVTIVILNWNGEKIFPACIESLFKLNYSQIEVLFVDNGSSDRSLEIARGFKDISIIENGKNLGYAAGNNRAISHISGKYVCFLNNDIIVDSAWLNDPVYYLENNRIIGSIACRNMDYFNTDIIDGLYHHIIPFFSLMRFGRGNPFIDDPLYSKPGFVLSALGSSAIYRTDLFKKLGGFDESFFSYLEDVDLCMRINNCGYRCLYVPTSIVYHMDQGSFGKNSKKPVYYSERNKYFIIKKNFPIFFIRSHLKNILLDDLRAVKCGLAGDRDLWLFLKAKIDSLHLLKHYQFSSGPSLFDSDYINTLISKIKIPL